MSESKTATDEVTCEKCGETFDKRGISAHEAACTGDSGADSPSGESAIPNEEWWDEGKEILGSLTGTEDRWENHSFTETVTKKAIRQMTDSQDEKAEMFRLTFGTCPECEERGINGWDSDTCNKCRKDDEEPDDDGDGDTITVTVDGKEVTGKPDEVKMLLNS